jgi:hypothetical protein
MTWMYQGQELQEIPEGYTAFVYLITNKLTNKKYIGKKLFYFTKTKSIKGKKKRIKQESDWKEYWSSSEDVKKDVKEYGEENFLREIIKLCINKGSASYYEAKEQFINEVLEKPEEWYNGQIQVRVHKTHIKK